MWYHGNQTVYLVMAKNKKKSYHDLSYMHIGQSTKTKTYYPAGYTKRATVGLMPVTLKEVARQC